MTANEAVLKIEMTELSVTVQKLYRQTAIADCSPSLWKFLKMTSGDVYGRGLTGPCPRPLIADLSHDIWLCEIGKRATWKASAYGRSFEEAVERAFSSMPSSSAGDNNGSSAHE